MGAGQSRFESLDGLRGIAAFAVLAMHAGMPFYLFDRAYLAVDFFFILSGFVIGHAYDARLQNGISPVRYLRLRLVRLYPMLAIGALLGLAALSVTPRDGYFLPAGQGAIILATIGQFLLIPCLAAPGAFALNGPQWSIVLELLANMIHALTRRWLTDRVLPLIFIAAFAVLILIGWGKWSLNFGWGRDNLHGGIARVLFGFFLGLWLYRRRDDWRHRMPVLSFPVVALLLYGLLALPRLPLVRDDMVRDALTIGIAMPLMVMLGAVATSGGRTARMLGILSYPLYAVHQPLLYLLATLLPLVQGNLLAILALYGGGGAAIVAVSYLLGRYVDLPLAARRHRHRAG